ncbi:MAG: hypothetical protein AB1451_04535 [Nitrospirota bacterium]
MDTGFFEYGLAALLGGLVAVALTIWTFVADGMSGGLRKGE